MMKPRKTLFSFIRTYKFPIFFSALFGSCTVLCNAGMLGASAVLISKAALLNGMLELMTLVALVRFFGLFRACFRYIERLSSHRITFRILGDLRLWYYQKLIPRLPSALGNRKSELFKNIFHDIELLQFFYLRSVAAPLVCVISVAILCSFLALFVKEAAMLFLLASIIEGLVFPLLFYQVQKKQEKTHNKYIKIL